MKSLGPRRGGGCGHTPLPKSQQSALCLHELFHRLEFYNCWWKPPSEYSLSLCLSVSVSLYLSLSLSLSPPSLALKRVSRQGSNSVSHDQIKEKPPGLTAVSRMAQETMLVACPFPLGISPWLWSPLDQDKCRVRMTY